MKDPIRNKTTYVTTDGKLALTLEWPFGLISPPVLELHAPLQGTVKFFHADSYQLDVPPEALLRDAKGQQLTPR
jgi:hypothetical protein